MTNKFKTFSLKCLPNEFWRIAEPISQRDYRGANLREADLSNAKLSNAKLSGADLSAAKLNKAELNEAKLNGAKLSGADLSEADLSGADLSEADLSGADLSAANISKANFKGDSKEDGAKKLTKEQIESACWDRKLGPPLLPDYLSNVDVDKMGHLRGSISSSGSHHPGMG